MTLGLKFCTCEFNIFMAFINIIREIINRQWLPKWPRIQWFSWKSLAPLEKSGLAVQGQVPLLYLPQEWKLLETQGFHKHQAQHFHCNLHPAQPLETIIFQQDDAPWNSTSSSASSSARKDTGYFFLHSGYLNRHKGLVEAAQIRGCQPTIHSWTS